VAHAAERGRRRRHVRHEAQGDHLAHPAQLERVAHGADREHDDVAQLRHPPEHSAYDAALLSSTSSGRARCSTTSRVTTHSLTPVSDGISYITSSMTSSRIARSPRAPELRRAASSAIAVSASGRKFSFTPSSSNSRWYCLASAFRGFQSTSVSA